MNKRQISFDKEKYKNEELMWADIVDVSRILIKQDYEVLIRYEDCGVYILEYAYDPDKVPGCDMFMVVTYEEADMIENLRLGDCVEDNSYHNDDTYGLCEEVEE